jgi:uncharacterized protein (DUF1778 family)
MEDNPFAKRNIEPLGPSKAATNLNLKLTEEEAEVFEKARNRLKLNRSDFMRLCISEKLQRMGASGP